MSQTGCRCSRGEISNYFAGVLAPVGLRGSSFTDADAVTHDRYTHRFLVQEFKRERESIAIAQHWMLADLAAIPNHFTVWIAVRRDDGWIDLAVYAADKTRSSFERISEDKYRERFRGWWAGDWSTRQ